MLTLRRGGVHVETKERAREFVTLAEEAIIRTDYVQAEELCRIAIRSLEPLLGPDHFEVGIAVHYLAVALEEQGRVEEALELLTRTGRIISCQATQQN